MVIHLLDEKTLFSEKISRYGHCKSRYLLALELIDRDSTAGLRRGSLYRDDGAYR